MNNSTSPVPISPVEDIIADMRAGRMVILVDEEDRENEGDLVLAAEHVSPEAINFMARFGRGLICLTLTRERCERLHLPPMATRNGTVHGTAFTVSIEAATGVTTGISAADRIESRSATETWIERVNRRKLLTAQGDFDCSASRDRAGGLHRALTRGSWTADDEVLVRVHEPLSVMDLLDVGHCGHSWPLP